MTSYRAEAHRGSIRTTVRLALAGILVLIVPQVVLTLRYLAELERDAARVASGGEVLERLERFGVTLDALQLPDTLEMTADRGAAMEQTLLDLAATAESLARSHPALLDDGSALVLALDDVRLRAREYLASVLQLQPPTAAPSAPGDPVSALTPPPPADAASVLAPLRERAVTALDRAVSIRRDASVRMIRALREARRPADNLCRRAGRNLGSLLMLTVIVMVTLFFWLPRRLARPLLAMTRTMRLAEEGRLDVALAYEGDDEIGLLASTVNRALRNARDFDERKRRRIVGDAAKIELLLERLEVPAAIIDASLAVEWSNGAFRELVGLVADDYNLALPDIFGTGRIELRRFLDSGFRGAGAASRRLTLTRDGQTLALRLEAERCRDGDGAVSHLLLLLEPIVTAPAERAEAPSAAAVPPDRTGTSSDP